MFADDAEKHLRQWAADPGHRHVDAARHAVRFLDQGQVGDLVAVLDDPHPCRLVDMMFAFVSQRKTWLNWVPMPSEVICSSANEIGGRRARGEEARITRIAVTAAEPASSITAAQLVAGPFDLEIMAFPPPDIRIPLRPGRYTVWRYDAMTPVPTVTAPSPAAAATLQEVAAEPWPSILSGYLQAGPLGRLPLTDLLGLLVHQPPAPDTARWRRLAESTPTYWYRLAQPWACLGMLHHQPEEPWATSTRRAVLTDLALGVEDWIADSALFALVTAAYRDAAIRDEVRDLVRTRLDAAVAARRLVTIEASLAELMLITPGCRPRDRTVAKAALNQASSSKPANRRWWRRR